MERKSIVAEICDQADGFLAGVAKREEAKTEIAEWLTTHRFDLSPEEQRATINEVIAVLDQENFFGHDAGDEDGANGDLMSNDR